MRLLFLILMLYLGIGCQQTQYEQTEYQSALQEILDENTEAAEWSQYEPLQTIYSVTQTKAEFRPCLLAIDTLGLKKQACLNKIVVLLQKDICTETEATLLNQLVYDFYNEIFAQIKRLQASKIAALQITEGSVDTFRNELILQLDKDITWTKESILNKNTALIHLNLASLRNQIVHSYEQFANFIILYRMCIMDLVWDYTTIAPLHYKDTIQLGDTINTSFVVGREYQLPHRIYINDSLLLDSYKKEYTTVPTKIGKQTFVVKMETYLPKRIYIDTFSYTVIPQ